MLIEKIIFYKLQRKIYLHQFFMRLLGSSLIKKGHLKIVFQNTLTNPVLDFFMTIMLENSFIRVKKQEFLKVIF